ncbi:MAG TPA: PEP-CTERM-box response regulator transcription factor [Stellaceae bacterium]|nr:PEP-CTERM-box response regulator transcription factor [Stellaceae bacterium]
MSKAKRKLLIVEDDLGLQSQLAWTFEDYEVLSATDRESALPLAEHHQPAVVTLDLGLPPDPDGASEGLATLQKLRQVLPHTKIIVVTGSDEREHALKAIALGAYDFYQKPIDADTIRLIVSRAYNLHALESENRRLQQMDRRSPLRGLVTGAPAMLNACSVIERVAPTSVSVLLLGESGTGKEVIARALHELSPRESHRFVAINCAAIPENLLESELFGHEKGAFTGAHKQVIGKIELADQGTLFLDEIGDMPMPLQAKLLRFIQERNFERVGGRSEISVDVRIICATHRKPDELIKANLFREDLYYRLSELAINIPPLRQRPGDPVLLARHFLNTITEQTGRNIRGLSPDAMEAVARYPWPGNVRELENRVKRAVIMADGMHVTAADLDLPVGERAAASPTTLREARERAEREAVQNALAQVAGNVTQAAKILDVSRPTLYDLLRHHNIRA